MKLRSVLVNPLDDRLLSSSQPKMDQPKRVIIRLLESDFNDSDPYQLARLYFTKCGLSFEEETTKARHFIHIQLPGSDAPVSNPIVHLIIDVGTDHFSGTLHANLPHEVYAIQRIDGELDVLFLRFTIFSLYFSDIARTLLPFREAYRDIYIRRAREVTDDLYPWGMTENNSLRSCRIKRLSIDMDAFRGCLVVRACVNADVAWCVCRLG